MRRHVSLPCDIQDFKPTIPPPFLVNVGVIHACAKIAKVYGARDLFPIQLIAPICNMVTASRFVDFTVMHLSMVTANPAPSGTYGGFDRLIRLLQYAFDRARGFDFES